MAHPDPHAGHAHEPAADGPKGLRAWIKKPLVLGGLLIVPVLLIAGGIGAWMATGTPPLTSEEKLAEALERLDAGDVVNARRLAAEMRTDTKLSDAELAGPMFVLGCAMSHDASTYAPGRQRQILFRVAARYFEEARNRGIPEEREAEGLYQFGNALIEAGRHAYAVEALKDALAIEPQPRATEIHRLLAEAYLQQKPALPVKAAEEIAQYLRDQSLQPKDRDTGLLWLARVYLQTNQLGPCRQAVELISPETPLQNELRLITGRLLLAEGDAVRGEGLVVEADSPSGQKYAAALEQLTQVKGRDHHDGSLVAQGLLLQALVLEHLGDDTAAEDAYSRIRKQYFSLPEALAATVRLGSLQVRRKETYEGLQLLEKGAADAASRPEYDNPWLTREEFEQRLEDAYKAILAEEQFETAITFAEAWRPFATADKSVLARATGRLKWAEQLEAQANGKPASEAEAIRAHAREQYRLAGEAFEELAQLRLPTKFYEDDLWSSAEGYFKGQAYLSSSRLCRKFLKTEPRTRRPDALAMLGECLLSQGKFREAVEIFQLCLDDYPKHPASYRSRLKSGLASLELGEFEAARQMLMDNLYGYALTPRSPEWRDSLFALGDALYRAGLECESRSFVPSVDANDEQRNAAAFTELEQGYHFYQEAIKNLSEAVRRFPDAPQQVAARYRIAESLRHSAKFARKRLNNITIETARITLHRQLQHDLTEAEQEYARLLQQIDDDQQGEFRSAVEIAITRNSYFGRADALFDLGRYEDAVDAYSAATNRYQAEPEALEAYVQIAACYRRLSRFTEARGTIEQARVVLGRIRPDADFNRTTRFSRDQWGQFIDWLATL